jgi:hypothetical protein
MYKISAPGWQALLVEVRERERVDAILPPARTKKRVCVLICRTPPQQPHRTMIVGEVLWLSKTFSTRPRWRLIAPMRNMLRESTAVQLLMRARMLL